MTELKKKVESWKVSDLKPYPLNAKIHTRQQVLKIAASIREFGWTQPIIVDKDGVIIAGHGRRLAAIELGHVNVPALVRDDLSDSQVRALRLADNRVAEGSIDTEAFRQELASLDFDMSSFFDAKELEFSALDLGTVNLDSFIEDVAGAVDQQEQASRQAATNATTKPVSVAKVLGFKEIPGAKQLSVSRFMAEIESVTGLTGADAFVKFGESFVANRSK